jgi:hypothetical protein
MTVAATSQSHFIWKRDGVIFSNANYNHAGTMAAMATFRVWGMRQWNDSSSFSLFGCVKRKLVYDRPQPDVDSLAPARSALRAFGFAEFLSPILPIGSCLPRREGTAIARFLVLRKVVRQIQSQVFQ